MPENGPSLECLVKCLIDHHAWNEEAEQLRKLAMLLRGLAKTAELESEEIECQDEDQNEEMSKNVETGNPGRVAQEADRIRPRDPGREAEKGAHSE
jgi:hypothetical protein